METIYEWCSQISNFFRLSRLRKNSNYIENFHRQMNTREIQVCYSFDIILLKN